MESQISLHTLLPRPYGLDQGFESISMMQVQSEVVLDMERKMTVAPLPMTPEEAAQRGLMGPGSRR